MAKLKYKIIEKNASPKGKSRVYFCAHHDDYKRYFDAISDEILKISDCAIWFDIEPLEKYDEELFLDLLQMQLFVMPVTTKLLTENNRAIDVELNFAIQNNIPVLPLMQEEGLDELFYQKFGDMQYLMKGSNDITELPYDEKLKKYLSSILVGDELAAKIRAAFDAYIFLSYRKKDRKYAQELMKLVHKNDFCRDIAIWYDEFLTPGESFNDSICDALKKSSLFALAVTPNLINEQNYVMTTEYPMAMEEGKDILPVEMVKTSYDELQRMYNDIPQCISKDNENELSEALANNLKRIALSKNDLEPEHNFFIGLAYLSGIDVEIDHSRALDLITVAAESGLREAVEKLVSMYRYGEGVKRDYEKEYFWQKRLVEIRKSEYDIDNTDISFENYAIELGYLGDCADELGIDDEAEKFRNDLVVLCKTMQGDIGKYYLAKSYSKLASSKHENRDLQMSLYYRLLAIDEYKILADKQAFDSSLSDLAYSYQEIGDLALEIRNVDKALENYNNALSIRLNIANDQGTNEARSMLAHTYIGIGRYYNIVGDNEKALLQFKNAYDIFIDLVNGIGGDEYLYDIASACDRIGDIYNVKQQFDEAEKYFLKMFEFLKKEDEQAQTLRSLFNLSVAYERLGLIYMFTENIEKAEFNMKNAFDLREKYCRKTNSANSRISLAIITTNLGRIAYFKQDFEIAKEYFYKGYDISYDLAKENPSAENYENLAEAYFTLGAVEEKEDKQQEMISAAYELWLHLKNEFPDVEMYEKKCKQVKKYLVTEE